MPVAAMCILLAVFIFTGCASDKEPEPPGGEITTTNTSATIAPFELEDLEGNFVDNNMFTENDITLLNVWATWCPPCIEELPALSAINSSMENDGVRVIGILLDAIGTSGKNEEAISRAKDIIKKAGADFTVIVPDEDFYDIHLSAIDAVPTTFIVDSDGRIIDTLVGSMNEDQWRIKINEFKAEK